MFTTKEDALKVYEEAKSVRAVIQRLVYPTPQTFYQWLREKNNPTKKVPAPQKNHQRGGKNLKKRPTRN